MSQGAASLMSMERMAKKKLQGFCCALQQLVLERDRALCCPDFFLSEFNATRWKKRLASFICLLFQTLN